jgi:hypothetical protein
VHFGGTVVPADAIAPFRASLANRGDDEINHSTQRGKEIRLAISRDLRVEVHGRGWQVEEPPDDPA